jgi:hypothetical protein
MTNRPSDAIIIKGLKSFTGEFASDKYLRDRNRDNGSKSSTIVSSSIRVVREFNFYNPLKSLTFVPDKFR